MTRITKLQQLGSARDRLTADERALLIAYRNLNGQRRELVVRIIRQLTDDDPDVPKTKAPLDWLLEVAS